MGSALLIAYVYEFSYKYSTNPSVRPYLSHFTVQDPAEFIETGLSVLWDYQYFILTFYTS